MGRNSFTEVKTQHIVVWYTQDHLTLQQISKLTGMTRQAVNYRLQKAGIKGKQGTWVTLNCSFCNKEFQRKRCLYRKSDKHFCSQNCYALSLINPNFIPWR